MRAGVLLLGLAAAPAWADDAEVIAATLRPDRAGYTVSVTLRHGDTGWEDYADGWSVESADGKVLAIRVLTHPHVTEQPFTRSLGGVAIPDGTTRVFIRARTKPDGWSKAVYPLDLDPAG